jgi:RHS repeat-associated protein
MKSILTLLTSFLLTLASFAQTSIPNEYPAWGQPIIKKLISKDPSVIGYGIKGNDKFINIAILDKKTKMLYWISCEGYIIEASQLTDIDYSFLISKKLDPFQLHQLLYKRDIQITDNAIEKVRFPKNKFYSSNDPNYDKYITQIIHSKQYDTLKTSLQKLSALYKSDQHYIYHLAHTEISHPLKAKTDSIYKKYLADIKKGSINVSEHTDSIGTAVFYNKDELSPIYKAVLDIPSTTLYFWRTDQTIFDSIAINRKQILKLIDEGTDVFTLYQNYNLWQLTTFDNTVKQLHDYYTNSKANPKQKKETEILLVSFDGGKEALVNKLHEAEGKILQKLNILFDVDKNYLEQALVTSFAYSTKPIQGLVLSAPTTPYDTPRIYTQTRGDKLYQLTDQRGNVMVVITDKKIPHDDNHDGIVDYYTADVVKATDYSSFGAPLPGRTFEIKDYKYGYNGKENDKETGYQDYGFRMYDPNIARFISVDPLTKKYPWYSPYQFAGNKPIWFTDLDGLEENSTSTYVYHPPVLALKPSFKGVISISDATSDKVHQTFQGNFAQLAKTGDYGRRVVNALVGSNVGNESSKLDITMTGTRSDISKSWKGVDKNYYTQFSYSFTNNNVTESGTFELKSSTIPVSARAWDALTFLLVNRVVTSILAGGVSIPTRLVRVVPENVQATTLARTTEADAFVANPAELKGLNATQIAEKLTLKNADGSFVKGPFKLIEFDTPVEGLAQPFNRTNPGFVNGGKTAGGATEYVVPNMKVNELKNVTETIIK